MSHLLKKSGQSINTPIELIVLTSIDAADNDKEKAMATLRKTLDAGYRDFAALDSNAYLENLRKDPRYEQLIRQYRK